MVGRFATRTLHVSTFTTQATCRKNQISMSIILPNKHLLNTKKVLNETGSILLSKGYPSLSAFIMDVTKPHPGVLYFMDHVYIFFPNNRVDAPPKAAHLVAALVETFPAFNDKSTFQGKEIFVHKKAQLLAADLYRKFKVLVSSSEFTSRYLSFCRMIFQTDLDSVMWTD